MSKLSSSTFYCLFVVCAFISINAHSAIDLEHPDKDVMPVSLERYTIEVGSFASQNEAETAAEYINNLLPLSLFLLKPNDRYILYAGLFSDQQEAVFFAAELKRGDYSGSGIRRQTWSLDEVIKVFAKEYMPDASSNQLADDSLRIDFSKRVGMIKITDKTMWLSVQNDPVVEEKVRLAWSEMEQKNYKRACKLFESILVNQQAFYVSRFGLAYCRHFTNKPDAVVKLLEPLVALNFLLDDTIPLLITNLEKAGLDDKAKHYRDLFNTREPDYWRRHQKRELVRVGFSNAERDIDTKKVIALKDANIAYLEKCELIDYFFATGNYLIDNGKRREGAKLFEKMLDYCPNNWHLRLGVFNRLRSVEKPWKLMATIESEKKREGLPSLYQEGLEKIYFEVMLEQAGQSIEGSDEQGRLLHTLSKIKPDDKRVLLAIGWWRYARKDYQLAKNIFSDLLGKPDSGKSLSDSLPSDKKYINREVRQGAREGLIRSMASLDDIDEAIELAEQYQLSKLKIELTTIKLLKIKSDNPELVDVSRELLDLDAQNKLAFDRLCWFYFNEGEVSKSRECFSEYYIAHPNEVSALEGYGFSLLRDKKVDEAGEIIREKQDILSDKIDLLAQFYLAKALQAYSFKKYAEALRALDTHQGYNENNEAAIDLRAWIYYQQGAIDKAQADFEKMIKYSPNESSAKALISLYEQSGNAEQLQRFLKELKLSNNAGLKKAAADYLFRHQQPIQAAQIYEVETNKYFHANKPEFGVTSLFHTRDGERGSSQFDHFRTFLNGSIFTYPGRQWQLIASHEKLDSGKASQLPFIGNAYLNSPNTQSLIDLNSEKSFERVWLRYSAEDALITSFVVGTTGSNHYLSNKTTFALTLKNDDQLWALSRVLKNDSLLSYAGLHDPYGQGIWGQVLDNTLAFDQQFKWRGFDSQIALAASYLEGENVESNEALQFSFSFGETVPYKNTYKSQGLFVHAAHFNNNQNYFTYGHGGYYSPQSLLVLGPYFSLQKQVVEKSWWQAEFSLSAFNESSRASDFYPLNQSGVGATGTYDSGSNTGLGGRVKLQGKKLLSKYFELSGLLDWQKGADHDDLNLQLDLKFYLHQRNAIMHTPVEPYYHLP